MPDAGSTSQAAGESSFLWKDFVLGQLSTDLCMNTNWSRKNESLPSI